MHAASREGLHALIARRTPNPRGSLPHRGIGALAVPVRRRRGSHTGVLSVFPHRLLLSRVIALVLLNARVLPERSSPWGPMQHYQRQADRMPAQQIAVCSGTANVDSEYRLLAWGYAFGISNRAPTAGCPVTPGLARWIAAAVTPHIRAIAAIVSPAITS